MKTDTNKFSRVPLREVQDSKAIPSKTLWSNIITSKPAQQTSQQPSTGSGQPPNRKNVLREPVASGSGIGPNKPNSQTGSTDRNFSTRLDDHQSSYSDTRFQNKIPVLIN